MTLVQTLVLPHALQEVQLSGLAAVMVGVEEHIFA